MPTPRIFNLRAGDDLGIKTRIEFFLPESFETQLLFLVLLIFPERITFSLYSILGSLKGSDDLIFVARGSHGTLSCCLNPDTETFHGFYDTRGQHIQARSRPGKHEVKFAMDTHCYTLVVFNVEKEDAGEYSCKTAEGQSVSFRMQLDRESFLS